MKKADIYGIMGSAITCIIVILLLLFIYMPGMRIPESEGIEISFGNPDAGGGGGRGSGIEASRQIAQATSTTPDIPATPVPPVTQTLPVNNRATTQNTGDDVMTQEDPSVAIAAQQEKERKKREEEAEQKRIEEQKRQETERQIAEERKREEQRRQQQIIDNANALGSAFGSNASSGQSSSSGGTGSGTGSGGGIGSGHGSGIGSGTESGIQGNPVGTRIGSPSLSLGNRRFRDGNYTKPNYTRNVEGIVTISIRVNEKGDVIGASMMASGTTISDEATINSAVDAARKTKFTEGESVVTGTITYHFQLN